MAKVQRGGNLRMKIVDTRDDVHKEIIRRVKRITGTGTLAKILDFIRSCTD